MLRASISFVVITLCVIIRHIIFQLNLMLNYFLVI